MALSNVTPQVIKDIKKLTRGIHKQQRESKADTPGYIIENGCLYRCLTDKEGNNQKRRIANFVATPIGEVLRDDGVEASLTFKIACTISGKPPLPLIQIPAERFHGMAWIEQAWGMAACIEPGQGNRDLVRHFIQQQAAAGIPQETVYTHTGWRQRDGGDWFYLHAGGAINGEGMKVNLSEDGLGRYELPERGEIACIRTSLQLKDIAPLSVMVPLLATVYLCPLMEPLRQSGIEPAFLPWITGTTGEGKSTLAALLVCHFGDFNNKTLPASFKDTANYLERKAFSLKDSMLVIDDYHPVSSGHDALKMESTAQALCRMFGDRTARGRLTSDIKARPSKPARGMAIVTGEDIPALGQSGMARILVIELEKGALDFTELGIIQGRADDLRQAMAAYIEWLAPQMPDLPKKLLEMFLEHREGASLKGHKRMPETAAWLYMGWASFLDFAVDKYAVTDEEAEVLKEEGWQVILQLCKQQGKFVEQEKPSTRFIVALSELLDSGEAVVNRLTGFEDNALREEAGRPLIGWCDQNYYYLIPGETYKAIARYCREQGGRFPVSERSLWKALAQEGLVEISGTDKDRRYTIQQVIGRKKKRVIKISAELISPLSDKTGETGSHPSLSPNG